MSTKRRATLSWVVAGLVAATTAIVAPAASATTDIARPATAVEAASAPTAASALSASQFNPGLIISDAQFFDNDALTQAQIQSFLVSKVGYCANSNCLANLKTTSTSRSADAWCLGIGGSSNETAASIIYKVQRACGVSAKAILVTLQKEQGLITDHAPTSGELRIAMGYGCPDTSACDSLYYGFFNQIYNAARQFQRYGGPGLNWYPLGQVSAIRYHPNAACGAKNVLIQNRATAALYYYTPYTPNPAALANLGGTGDACSSYGNRNFWYFYNTWFAATAADATAAINQAYSRAGGASGALGAATGSVQCVSGVFSCTQRFTHGLIYWTNAGGALAVSGALGDLYLSIGGASSPIGVPLKEAASVNDPNGDGLAQQFTGGYIHSGSPGTFATTTKVMNGYSAAGWLRGYLGWPTSAEDCGPAGTACIQTFQGGRVIGSPSGAGRALDAVIAAVYDAAGAQDGSLGYPLDVAAEVTDPNGSGLVQRFQSGWIHAGNAGAFVTSNRAMTAYSAAGWLRGELGWPTSEETCGADGTPCVQTFDGGYIVTPSSGAAARMPGPIADAYAQAGGPSGSLGLPLAVPSPVTDKNGNGYAGRFDNGWIHAGPEGAFTTSNSTMAAYSAAGWLRGFLGWPAGEEHCDSAGCSQEFAGAMLVVPTSGATLAVPRVTDSAIRAAYDALGGASGWLGQPVATSTAVTDRNGNGVVQRFENGWIHSSSRGAFATSESLMIAYSAAGWVRGALGWPTGDQICDASQCSQQFAGGILRKSSSAPAVTDAKIRSAYEALGGVKSYLGLPIAASAAVTDPNGNGVVQRFEGGWIHSSSAGAFATGTKLMTAYSAAKWVRGSLGWPTAHQVCSALGCSQTFAGGVLSIK
jgi:uncharacterized protein with LGFP repeats